VTATVAELALTSLGKCDTVRPISFMRQVAQESQGNYSHWHSRRCFFAANFANVNKSLEETLKVELLNFLSGTQSNLLLW
jgi:hypothetical protein